MSAGFFGSRFGAFELLPFLVTAIYVILTVDIRQVISRLSGSPLQISMAIGVTTLHIATVLEILTYFGAKQEIEKSGARWAIEPLRAIS